MDNIRVKQQLDRAFSKPFPMDVLLGVLVFLKDWGVDGILLNQLHTLFYKARKEGFSLLAGWRFNPGDIKPWSETVETAKSNLYLCHMAYYNCPPQSPEEDKLRIWDTTYKNFNRYGKIIPEDLNEIIDIAKFIRDQL